MVCNNFIFYKQDYQPSVALETGGKQSLIENA